MATDLEHIEIPVGSEVFDALAAGPDDGELVLLLHGFPQRARVWRRQLVTLAEAGYRAVAPDQRGYSPRARPVDDGRYAMGHLVGDVLAMAYELGGHRFHLVGHDWGAVVAWQVAGRHGSRLRTLTALSVPHPAAFAAALADPGGDQRERSSYVPFFRSEGAAEAVLDDDATLLRQVFTSSGMPEDEDLAPYVEAMRQPGALDAALAWYRTADPADAEGLEPIPVPTLFVWSSGDISMSRVGAEATGDHVAGPYRFEVLDGVSHWIAEEAPDRLGALLLEHLGGRTGGVGGP